jgi:predicted membrane-bound spermidine synthase
MTQSRDGSWLVLGLFFCSGATALVYEVVWSKCLALMFGSTIHAQTVVLAVFMGGLALGNHFFGRNADRWRQPLSVYAYIEFAIALYAFGFVTFYGWADRLFVAVGTGMLENRWPLLGLKGGLSCALLIGPTILMGGTLPLVAAWLRNRSGDAANKSARFYAVNSLGAVCGAGLAGFYLVRTLGIASALQFTALLNALIGVIALFLSRGQRDRARTNPAVKAAPPAPHVLEPMPLRWAGLMVAITGAVSMGLEVLASRSLALVFGASLQSFAIVLIAFILGIGLGSAVITSRFIRRFHPYQVITVLLLAAAVWTSLLIFNVEWGVNLYRYLRIGISRTPTGYTFHQILTGLIAVGALGLPAAWIGAVLPLFIRSLPGIDLSLEQTVGRLLTWNTLGAVIGVLFAGFVLMPRFGLRGAIGTLVLLLCMLALFTAWRRPGRWLKHLAGGVAALVLLLLVMGGAGWRNVMSSGVFRSRETSLDPGFLESRKHSMTVEFYEDAPDATVTVERTDLVDGPPDFCLKVNGKTDASSQGDLSTQLLLGHLPMLARPESKEIFLLGLGSGITGGAILAHPIERLIIAENCEPVVRASQFFDRWNRRVLANPRTQLWMEDACTVLKLNPQKYDVIITEPSNPWTVGVGSVFSREYYELAASRLKEGGMMAQWFHVYEANDRIVSLVMRTFKSVFPHLEVWDTGGGDIILLGSKQPWPLTLEHWQIAFARDGLRKDLKTVHIVSPAALLARQLASQRTAFAIAGEGPVQSDWFPLLEYEAPAAFYVGGSSQFLTRFDERTWQMPLAPDDKRRALATLTDEVLEPIFARSKSLNVELNEHLRWRFHCRDTGREDIPLDPLRSPCVFRAAKTISGANDISAQATDETKRIWQAGDWIERNSERKEDGVSLIEAQLRRRGPDSTWSAALYSALAARASIAAGRLDQAQSLINLGLQSAPSEEQLEYLDRIVKQLKRSQPQLSSTQ